MHLLSASNICDAIDLRTKITDIKAMDKYRGKSGNWKVE